MTLPPTRRAELQRYLDEIARKLLRHKRDCADEQGEYSYTPDPNQPGEVICDRCGEGFGGSIVGNEARTTTERDR